MTLDEVRTRLLDYLPDAYAKDPGTTNYGLMTGYASEINVLYGALSLLHSELYVNTATGQYLDDLAKIFRLARKTGETDAQFRGRIKAYWSIFSGGATVQAIKDAIQALTTVDVPEVEIDEFEPMKFRVIFPLPDLDNLVIESVIDATFQAKAAGVWPFFTATNTIASEGVSVGESFSITANDGIIVGYYDVSSAAMV